MTEPNPELEVNAPDWSNEPASDDLLAEQLQEKGMDMNAVEQVASVGEPPEPADEVPAEEAPAEEAPADAPVEAPVDAPADSPPVPAPDTSPPEERESGEEEKGDAV